jgi:hypothetical protein
MLHLSIFDVVCGKVIKFMSSKKPFRLCIGLQKRRERVKHSRGPSDLKHHKRDWNRS